MVGLEGGALFVSLKNIKAPLFLAPCKSPSNPPLNDVFSDLSTIILVLFTLKLIAENTELLPVVSPSWVLQN